METTITQQVPLNELRAGDRIEWADSDKGQGKFWREVTVTGTRPMDEKVAHGRMSITVENDAGVRTARSMQLPTTTHTRIVRLRGGKPLSSNDAAALRDALAGVGILGAAHTEFTNVRGELVALALALATQEKREQAIDERAAAAAGRS